MPNLVKIVPVVWAPNPNKQTDRQTDRHLSFIYIDSILKSKKECWQKARFLRNIVDIN